MTAFCFRHQISPRLSPISYRLLKRTSTRSESSLPSDITPVSPRSACDGPRFEFRSLQNHGSFLKLQPRVSLVELALIAIS
jgi:hypothetical protein